MFGAIHHKAAKTIISFFTHNYLSLHVHNYYIIILRKCSQISIQATYARYLDLLIFQPIRRQGVCWSTSLRPTNYYCFSRMYTIETSLQY